LAVEEFAVAGCEGVRLQAAERTSRAHRQKSATRGMGEFRLKGMGNLSSL
jgi:hypothetical protein